MFGYEPKGQGFESLAARHPQVLDYQGFAVFLCHFSGAENVLTFFKMGFIWDLLSKKMPFLCNEIKIPMSDVEEEYNYMCDIDE